MKIALYPYQDKNNPFVRLLRAALEKQDIFIAETDRCNPIWLLRHRKEVHALHFHWIQSLYYDKTYLGTVFGLLRFSINLLSARIMKYRIVWTVHNLFPHQSRYKRLDRLARKIIVFFSSAIVVHCDYARRLAQKMLRIKKDITVIPHGHYADYYKTALDQQAARSLFELPSAAQIFLMIGRIEPYKGIVDLIRHFKDTHQDSLLVIAGQPSDSELANHILKQANNDRRIITILRRLDDEELAHLIAASDVVVVPFTNILTSGSVVAALSLGRPVITPRMG
ncbi:MAG: glycosyltransferase, partial [Desulfobacterales bacterium]